MPSTEISWVEPDPSRAAEMSGLEALRASIAGELPAPPITCLMGIDLVAVEPGRCELTLVAGGQHSNPVGVVHGGALATLMDAATGVAVQTELPVGAGYSTIDLHVRYLRPVRPGQVVAAVGRTVRMGRTLASSAAEARDGEGRLLCTATAAYHLTRAT